MGKDIKKEINNLIKNNNLSRRDALKLLSLSSISLMTSQELKAQENIQSNKKVSIVIIGGGLAGIASAARLREKLPNSDITIIEPNSLSASYQAGNTLLGAGIYEKSDVIYNTNDFLPYNVKWIKEKAIDFFPENNTLTLSNNEKIAYDYLIISAGVVLDFEKIKGLEELKNLYTQDNATNIKKYLQNTGISSVYNTDLATLTWENMNESINKAHNGEKINAIFTHPNTPIKCGGAPKKMMYLMNARLNEKSDTARLNTNLEFFTNSSKMFAIKEYEEAIISQFNDRNMKYNLQHNLKEVDLKNKTATFDKFWEEKGPYDIDLEEYSTVTKHENIKINYDFLHVTPPMKAAPELGNSVLGSSNGWIPVDKQTLQHANYDNVFSLGDIAAIPLGKTGGSVRKQYKILCENIVSLIEGKEMKAKYDGYTVCPIITDIGKVMLAEFDWSMKPTPSFPLDPTKQRYIWWILKAYLLKPMTQYGMLQGKI